MNKIRWISMVVLACAVACTACPDQGLAAGGEYRIGKGDILRIVTWKEPDLSMESTMVRLDGKITFPLLDDVQAAGLSTMALKRVIEQGLSRFVEAPQVTVTILETVSQKFYILGEVQKTGEFALVKSMTVLQAFAVAGGFTEWASKNEIILVRKVDGQDTITRISYKDIIKGKELEANIMIQADDTIIVP